MAKRAESGGTGRGKNQRGGNAKSRRKEYAGRKNSGNEYMDVSKKSLDDLLEEIVFA